jgi:hypothetical protein
MRKGTDTSDDESDEDMHSVSSVDDSADSSGESESSISDDENPKRRMVVKKVVKKAAAAKKKTVTSKKKAVTPVKSKVASNKDSGTGKNRKAVKSESESDTDDEEGGTSNKNEVKVLKQVLDRTYKESLVAKVLSRWWYVMPQWPPLDYDYSYALEKARLRLVPLDRWEDENDVDSLGMMKCYALSQYPGLYRDATGGLRDLRPIEGKPCFSELMKRTEKELQAMLSEAISKQIEILSKQKDAAKLISELKDLLKNVKNKNL